MPACRFENDWNIYGWAGYQNREGNSAAFPRIFNDARNVPAIYPNGFLPLITTDIDDHRCRLGRARQGRRAGIPTSSLVYGSNKVAYGVEHSLNTSYGAASQTSFDAGAMKYDQFTFNAQHRARLRSRQFARSRQRGTRHRSAARELRHRRRRTGVL